MHPGRGKVPPILLRSGRVGGFCLGAPVADGRSGFRAACAAAVSLAALLAFSGIAPGASATGPVVQRDVRGVPARLDAPPRRVVSLAPNLTEIVFLLGREESLVGATRYCNVPPEAKSIPRIGGIGDPDVERIVALVPDLVLCTTDGNPREKVLTLEGLGIPCYCVAPQDLEGLFAAVEGIGTLLGVPERALKEAEALRRRAARAGNPGARPAPRVLFVLSTSPVIAAGEGTFLDEIVRAAGGRNAAVAWSGRYPRLSVEDLLAASPDVILVASMTGVERFSPSVTRWRQVPAFRDGAVLYLDGDLVTRPGPRMVTALEEVSRILTAWRARAATAGGRGGTEP
jgi:iron complex transport system substrate-binding protein